MTAPSSNDSERAFRESYARILVARGMTREAAEAAAAGRDGDVVTAATPDHMAGAELTRAYEQRGMTREAAQIAVYGAPITAPAGGDLANVYMARGMTREAAQIAAAGRDGIHESSSVAPWTPQAERHIWDTPAQAGASLTESAPVSSAAAFHDGFVNGLVNRGYSPAHAEAIARGR